MGVESVEFPSHPRTAAFGSRTNDRRRRRWSSSEANTSQLGQRQQRWIKRRSSRVGCSRVVRTSSANHPRGRQRFVKQPPALQDYRVRSSFCIGCVVKSVCCICIPSRTLNVKLSLNLWLIFLILSDYPLWCDL